jgi:ribosomal subunit interface protein
MNIHYVNRHDSAHGDIKTYIETELGFLADKYEIADADVILDRDGHTDRHFTAEIKLHVKGGVLHCKETSDEIGKSIDIAVKTMEGQLKKHKETHFTSHEIRRHAALEK